MLLKKIITQQVVWGLGCAFAFTAIAIPGATQSVEQNRLAFPEGKLRESIASESNVVLEDEGTLIVIHGSECGESDRPGEEDTIELEGSIDIPSYADNATVLLNGWSLKYLSKDHHIGRLGTGIQDIRIEENQLKWQAIGFLSDKNFDDGYQWCYYYTAFAWNQEAIDAFPEHDDMGNLNGTYSFINGHEEVALVSIPSYIQNSVFADKKAIAVLPRGFSFAWEDRSAQKDHHLLQLAYNLDHSEVFIEAGKDYAFLPNPTLPTDASRVDSGFVSWETFGIFKDNKAKRDYAFVEVFSALGGNDVGVVQPPFSIIPREDTGFPGACIGESEGVKTEEYTIENVPFEYAIPMLTGWELGYVCDDEHVTEIGVWLHDLEYEKDPGVSVGTLRYKLSSVLRDKDSQPGHYFRHKVSILGLKPVEQSPVPPERIPDLVPVKPLPDTPAPVGFCQIAEDGLLLVIVKNQGNADAATSITTVEFPLSSGGSLPVEIATPALEVGESVELTVGIPPNCAGTDCSFSIMVDSQNQIEEFDENNNSADGLCIG